MPQDFTYNRFSSKWIILAIVLSILYWAWFGGVVGVKELEIGFYILMLFLFFFSLRTRQLAIAFSPFFFYLLCYSSLSILHEYNSFPIHIENLYEFEKSLFGFNFEGERIAPCDYFQTHTHSFLDFISGLFYISWVPFPIFFALTSFYAFKRKIVFDFWTAFLIANLIGFIGYIVFPAAPPWYYLEYGAELNLAVPNGAAGLSRFDELVGIPVYQTMYANGTNTFGAMPSMHAAFPLILVYYSLKINKKLLTLLFAISMVSIWFGAVYTNHHYIIDILVGILCGIVGIFLTELLVNRKFAPNWYQKTIEYIHIPKK